MVRPTAVDPQLMAQIEQAGDEGQVEAMLLLDQSYAADTDAVESGADAIIKQVSDDLNEQPVEVQQWPSLGAVYIKGSGKLVRELLACDAVVSASSNNATLATDDLYASESLIGDLATDKPEKPAKRATKTARRKQQR